MSDIDAIAVTEEKSNNSRTIEQIASLGADPNSPLFHISISIGSPRALRRIEPTFQAAEIRNAARVLVGEDIRPNFPEKFDPASAREAFFVNLWKPLLFEVLRTTQPAVYLHAMARQVLDAAILAFSEQAQCISGHRARAAAFLSLPERHALATSGVRTAIERAMQVRRGESVNIDEFEHRQWETIQTVLRFVDPEIRLSYPNRELPRRIERLLPRRSIRRLTRESLNGLRSGRFNPFWILRRKEAFAAAALLGLYQIRLDSPSTDVGYFTRTWLSRFSGLACPQTESAHFVKLARKIYWAGELRLRPVGAPERAWVESLLGKNHG